MTTGHTDSAGIPWSGRSFEPVAFSGDDGSAPAELAFALERFARGEAGEAEVVDAVRTSRLLVPLVAEIGASGLGAHGLREDKSAELAIVTVAGPDGRRVLPAFSSVDTMREWNPAARPVPADGVRVALAAASDRTELVVLDPGSPTEFVLRRPAVWAIAQSAPWIPSHQDADVLAAFLEAARPEPQVDALVLDRGDPTARAAGPELVVRLSVAPGLDRADLTGLLERLQARWSVDAVIAARVDSLAVTVIASAGP